MLEKTGQILWGKNEKIISPLASLTKLVAIKVFLDTKSKLDQMVTYKKADENYNNKYCAPGESAKLKVVEGDKLTVENLIYSALVGSANNAVESLVRVSGLPRAKFIARMNETVKKWGALDTNFIEPTGLSPDNVSSPLDYAIITKEAFVDPLLKKISTTPRYTFKTSNTKKAHTLTNTNQ
jgi:D-alanyl-D-alanine endopeptidase (penicillin-binding protein 7)